MSNKENAHKRLARQSNLEVFVYFITLYDRIRIRPRVFYASKRLRTHSNVRSKGIMKKNVNMTEGKKHSPS